MGTLARKIAKNNARAPFEVVIEYKGTYESGTRLGHIMGPAILKIMRENFRSWATAVMHHDFSEDDKIYLNECRFDLLSPIAKGLYEEIYFPALEYYANLFMR